MSRGLLLCKSCRHQTSIIENTLFQDTKKPLRLWLQAMWHITSQKYGANALGLKRILNLGSYDTAWKWLHKLRRAMVYPNRDMLSGIIEVDETLIGGKSEGKRGRGAEKKAIVVIGVEDKGDNNKYKKGIGRIRLKQVPDASSENIMSFIHSNIKKGSLVRTDGWLGYEALKKNGYKHSVVPSNDLIICHLVVSLLKRWLLGTYQGAVRFSQLDYYLDEYTFRFNRRKSAYRGKLFYRLMQRAVTIEPIHGAKLYSDSKIN